MRVFVAVSKNRDRRGEFRESRHVLGVEPGRSGVCMSLRVSDPTTVKFEYHNMVELELETFSMS